MSRSAAISHEDILALRRQYPRAFAAPLWVRLARLGLVLVAASLLFHLAIKLELISAKFVTGLDQTGTIVSAMWPPGPNSAESFRFILIRLGETVAMAFLGTLLASLIALPLGFIGAKTVIANAALHFIVRRLFDFFRGMPALIWALVFVRAVGLGPMTGVLAFMMSDFAPLAKLYAEAIETADPKELEGVRASGAGGITLLRFGLLPQVLPIMISQALYFFESNVRSAAILGIVGAGGIGVMLAEAIQFNLWREVAFIILLFLVTVALIDTGSRLLRERLIGRNERP